MALPTVTAGRVEVRNLDTGTVYYTKGTGTLNPASITKLLTVYIVRQHKVTSTELAEQVTIQSSDLTGGGTGANLTAGNILTIWQLIVNALLPSSNNSCLALARVIGQEFLDVESGGVGDPIARFVTEMATQAAALGMSSSSFTDPHGNNTTSATTPEDMNLLLDAMRTDSVLLDIWRWGEYRITMISGGDLTLTSTVDLVGDSGVFGGKTGYVAPNYNLCLLYEAPNGQTIGVTTMGSTSGSNRTADVRAILAELLVDYPELATPGTPWTPARLFDHHGFDGGWWDGSDTSTLWQDTAGTVAVTANNDPVGRWDPKEGTAAYWRQATSGARPLWKSATNAISLDGTDDFLSIGGTAVAGTGLFNSGTNEWMLYVRINTTDTQGTIIGRAGSTSASRTYQLYIDASANPGHNERGSNVSHGAGLNAAGLTAVGSFRDGTQSGTATESLGNLFKRAGTASEQTSEHILMGARTTAAPTSFLSGEISQVVIVDGFDADAFFRMRAWMQGAAVNAFADPTGGDVGPSGSLSATLGGASVTSAGVIKLAGSASITLGGAALSASADLQIKGATSATLAGATLSSSGTLAAAGISGAVSTSLDGATASAAGALAVSGALSRALDGATIDAAGSAQQITTGALSATLAGASSSAAGAIYVSGQVSRALDGAAVSAAGRVDITAALGVALDGASIVAAGAVPGAAISGALTRTLAGATLTASGGETAELDASPGYTITGRLRAFEVRGRTRRFEVDQ